jgi:hypothetical protein
VLVCGLYLVLIEGLVVQIVTVCSLRPQLGIMKRKGYLAFAESQKKGRLGLFTTRRFLAYPLTYMRSVITEDSSTVVAWQLVDIAIIRHAALSDHL